MGKVQQCRNGCKKLITVQFDDGIQKYVPFEVDTSGNPTTKHNCPNSEYNKNKNPGMTSTADHQQQQTAQQQFYKSPPPQQTTGIDKPSMEAILLNQCSQAISTLTKLVESVQAEMLQIKEKLEYNTQVDTQKLVGQLQIVFDAIAPITKTQFKVATELHNDTLEETSEEKYNREREQIAKWDQAKDVQAEDKELEDAGL